MLIFKKDRKKNLTLIGLPGSGKSAFIIALFLELLTRATKYGVTDVSVGGSFFKLSKILEEIQRGVPPRKTIPQQINKFGFKVKYNGKEMQIFLDDLSGEFLTDFGELMYNEESVMRKPKNRKFVSHLLKYDIFLIFYDPTQQNNALLMQSRALNRIAILLRKKRGNNIKFAIVISKCDLYPEVYDDPVNWIQEREILYGFLKKNYNDVQVFPVSAYGAAKQISENSWIPANKDFQPVGVYDVFQWIKKNLR